MYWANVYKPILKSMKPLRLFHEFTSLQQKHQQLLTLGHFVSLLLQRKAEARDERIKQWEEFRVVTKSKSTMKSKVGLLRVALVVLSSCILCFC